MSWRPALLLMVLSPLLAEVISGGTPVTLFFLPTVLLPYATLVYGIPVLILRDLAARRGYGPLRLWCLGVLYALHNEALLAQTFFHPLDSPVDTFTTYGLVGDVRVPFVGWIGVWHGIFSVLAPIVVVEYLFPAKADAPWLPRWAVWPLAAAVLALAAANFLFNRDPADTRDTGELLGHLGFLVVAGLALWLVAGWLPRTPENVLEGEAAGWKAICAGAVLYVCTSVVPEVLAQNRIPVPLFLLFLALAVAAAIWAVARRRRATRAEVLRFLLGAVGAQAVLAVIFGVLVGDVLWAAAGVMFTVVCVWGAVRVVRS